MAQKRYKRLPATAKDRQQQNYQHLTAATAAAAAVGAAL